MDTNRLQMLRTITSGEKADQIAHRFGLTRFGLLNELSAFERELGITLFQEENGSLYLTREGRDMLPFAEKVLQEEDAFFAHYIKHHQKHTESDGTVRIAAYSSQMISWLPSVLLKFMDSFPNYHLDVRVGAQMMEQWMTDNLVDVAILEKRLAGNRQWIYLMQDEMMVVAPASSKLADMYAVPIEYLEKHTVIFPTMQDTNCVVMEMRKNNIHCEDFIPFRTDDGSILLSLVAKGFGISFLSESYLQECPETVVMRPFKVPIYRKLGISSNASRVNRIPAQTFTDWVIRHYTDTKL